MYHLRNIAKFLTYILVQCSVGKPLSAVWPRKGFLASVKGVFLSLKIEETVVLWVGVYRNPLLEESYGFKDRKLFQIWNDRTDSIDKLSSQVVTNTFHDMEIYPSSSQVHEMLHCAKECSKRQDSNYITFGEFCVYASELKPCYDTKVPRPTPLSKAPKTNRKLSLRRRSSAASRSPKYQVFLGGSCNPTTWRKDTAIPFLKQKGISYYNPQVAMWVPELIELENQAKQNAEVMFFVIDNQTRSVASMIEASHIAGTMRKLILVLHEFEKPGCNIFDEKITEKEFRDLQQGHRYLQDIVERQGIPVFKNISDALKCTATILHKNIRPQDLTLNDDTRPVKMAYLKIGDKLIKLREVFDDLDSEGTGCIDLKDVCMAFKILTSTKLPIDNLKSIVSSQRVVTENTEKSESNADDVQVDFNQFCCIMTELRNQEGNESQNFDSLKNKASQFFCSALSPLSKLLRWPNTESKVSRSENDVSFSAECRHLYLGGTAKPSSWREDIAIPLIKKKGLTYFVPHNGVWSERLIPLEAANIENSQVLLFVITADSRSLAEMIVAVHYVGLGCQVVLCIQYIADDTVIDGEKLTTQAVKDYNRGRVYLSDLATRAGVPVFQNISEATECAINLCLSQHS